MSTRVEQHGCIVCGRMHTLKVTYGADGQVLGCEVTSLDGRCLPDPRRPIVACSQHSEAAVQAAYLSRYPGSQEAEEEDEER
jgi:hypothetical protein